MPKARNKNNVMTVTIKKFYNLFWSNPICKSIFLLHKEILLEKNTIDLKITDYYLPRIVISNSNNQKKSELKISSRSENIFIELLHKLNVSEKKYLNPDRAQQYINKRYGETKGIVLKEHPESGILGLIIEFFESLTDEADLLEFLKKYRIIPDEVESIQALGRYAEEELMREISKFLKKEEVSDILNSIDDVSDIYNSIMKKSLITANKQVTGRLFDDKNYKERLNVFESLYEIGILSGGYFKSYIECTNCLPKTYSGFFTCDISPSKLKFKCPNCNKETYFMVPYQIDRELYEHITDNDGLLANAISFLLDKHNIKYKRNYNLESKNEVDFVIMNGNNINGLIEVKMFRNDKSSDVQQTDILATISQVKKTKKKLVDIDPRYRNVEHIIISNITDEEIYQKVREKAEKDISDHKIFLMSPDDFAKSL